MTKLGPLLRFTECDTCAAKTGSPFLCSGCSHNRKVISAYDRASLKGDYQTATALGAKGRTKTWRRALELLKTPVAR